MFSIHRLVAETFIPNPNNYYCVNHKDENPLNNNVKNLEWCSINYNCNYGNRNKKISEKLKRIKNIIENSAIETYATSDTNACRKILQEIGEII